MILGECAVCPIRAGIKSDEVPVPGTSQNANTESASKRRPDRVQENGPEHGKSFPQTARQSTLPRQRYSQ